MNKEKALVKVNIVKEKRTDDYIQEVLIEVENNINEQELFSYQETMKFIESKMSNKLGGRPAFINKALVFLKNELKNEYRKLKNKK